MDPQKEYELKLRQQLDGWNAEIAGLEATFMDRNADTDIDYATELDALKSKHDALHGKLGEMESAEDDSWHTMRHLADKIQTELHEALEALKKRLG